MEECRAEAVALYLASNQDILNIFNYTDKQEAEDLVYWTFVVMARAGVVSSLRVRGTLNEADDVSLYSALLSGTTPLPRTMDRCVALRSTVSLACRADLSRSRVAGSHGSSSRQYAPLSLLTTRIHRD